MGNMTSRSRDDARAQIVDAATRLLREGGTGAVTTRAVAHAAGVQAPSIYRLFGDKDGLVEAVAEHVLAQWVHDKAAGLADEDPDPVVALRASWHRQVEFGLDNPELYVLLQDPRRRRSAATTAGVDVLRHRVGRLAAAGRLRVSEQRAVEMIHAAGTGTVLTLLATPADERDPRLADAMCDAVLSALTTDPPAAAPTGPLALAVGFAAAVPDLPGLRATERALLADWVGRSIESLERPEPPPGG